MTHRCTRASVDLRAWDNNALEESRVVILNPGMAELYLLSHNKASNLESNSHSLKLPTVG